MVKGDHLRDPYWLGNLVPWVGQPDGLRTFIFCLIFRPFYLRHSKVYWYPNLIDAKFKTVGMYIHPWME